MKGFGYKARTLFSFKKTMQVKTPPSIKYLSTEEAKRHLQIASGETFYDETINDYIEAAQIMLFEETNVMPAPSTLVEFKEGFEDFEIFVFPIESVVVKYMDSSKQEQTLPASSYVLDKRSFPASIEFESSPSLADIKDAVSVEITTGVVNNPMVKQCIRMLVADMFENRQGNSVGMTVQEMSRTTKHQLSLISKRVDI